jgi:citronellol/citronellal dehydrogenase
MAALEGKTVFITGASRGIGRAIALRCARDRANVVIAAKSAVKHPRLPGTIHSVAAEVEAAGGKALALKLDVRDESAVEEACSRAAGHFGGLDILVNNAGYISLTPLEKTDLKRFDLMMGINVRGAYACARAAMPYLLDSSNPHVLNLSPPISLEPRWLSGHAPYTISKYGMSMLVLGLAEEFRERGVAFNGLWPKTTIATAAIEVHFPEEILLASRKPEIMADAAYAIFCRPSRECTGRLMLDEEVLSEEGVDDFAPYAQEPGRKLFPDLFIDPDAD